MAMDAAFLEGPQAPSPTRVRDDIARRAAVRGGHRLRSAGVSGGRSGKFPGTVGALARWGAGNRKHFAAGGAPPLRVGEFPHEEIFDTAFGLSLSCSGSRRSLSLGA